MNFANMDRDTYAARLQLTIAETESLHARAQDLGDGKATIGWGYTFNRNDNHAIWQASGINLTEGQWRDIRDIDAAPTRDKTRLGLAFGRELNEAEANQLLVASAQTYATHADALDMPDSRERLALISVTYNRGEGAMRGHPLLDAIDNGERAEAWYQLRYNCWGSNAQYEAGLRKRRLVEAQVLGLYDDPADVGPDEARSVFRMVTQHREGIQAIERRFGETLEGEAGLRDLRALANRDYPGVTREFGQVPTLRESLEPARLALLAQLRADHPHLADSLADDRIDAASIHVDPGPGRRMENPVLQGGDGMDVFVLEDGAVLRDTDGRGMLFWNGRALTGSADAALHYRMQGNDLSVTDERGQSVRIENYTGGLGLHLPHLANQHGWEDAQATRQQAPSPWLAQLAQPLTEAGYSPDVQQRIASAWEHHLARHAHFGAPDRLLFSRDGESIAALHGHALSEMQIRDALAAQGEPVERATQILQTPSHEWSEPHRQRRMA
jgi:GH24 family phage-related lysozyme (muramidase)